MQISSLFISSEQLTLVNPNARLHARITMNLPTKCLQLDLMFTAFVFLPLHVIT